VARRVAEPSASAGWMPSTTHDCLVDDEPMADGKAAIDIDDASRRKRLHQAKVMRTASASVTAAMSAAASREENQQQMMTGEARRRLRIASRTLAMSRDELRKSHTTFVM